MATTAPVMGGGILDRAIRAARLDKSVYEEVEADTSATTQAAIVVVVGALASAVGIGTAMAQGTIDPAGVTGGGLGAIVGEVVAGLVGWAAYAYAAFLVGTTILKGAETHADWGQVARTLGFASAPRALFIVAVIPGLFSIASIVIGIWLLVTTVFAVRASLDVGTGRAVAIAIVAALALGIVQGIVGAIV